MNARAYSVLHVKAFDEERREFTGVASTPTPDRLGDIIEPFGISFKNPIPLLLYHDTTLPVGSVRLDTPTKDGVTFTAKIPKIAEPGRLKDRTDEAWQSVTATPPVMKGVSPGFRPLNDAMDFMADTGGIRFREIEILELSLVAVPANVEATIASIKSFDRDRPAASGTRRSVVVHASGAADPRSQRSPMKTYAESITAFENTRAAKVAERDGIQAKAMEEGRSKDPAEKEGFTRLNDEIADIDAELNDLRVLEQGAKKAAVPAQGGSAEEASRSRAGYKMTVLPVKLPPGIGFARAVKATMVAKLDSRNVLDVAREMFPSDERLHAHLTHMRNIPNIIMMLKAAVPAATTTNTTWAGALVDPTNLAGEFIEFLRPATIIGRLNLRNVPTNVRLIEQTQGGTGYWVGQGAPKPLTAFGFVPVTLSPTKVAAIAVASEESLRFSTPSLDQLIRDGLRDALVERVDRDLLDPAEAGTANVQPASLTSGLTALSSAGTSADNIRTDISRIVRALRTNNLRGPIAIVLPDSLLTGMAWMVNSLGQPEFPGLTGEGGTFNGIRFVGSEYVANPSGAGNMVVGIAEREVFLSDDGGVRVDASNQASLQMLDNPTNNAATATPTTMVSMWQTNSVAYRSEWFVNWQKRRTDAVVYMDDVNWGSVGSPSE